VRDVEALHRRGWRGQGERLPQGLERRGAPGGPHRVGALEAAGAAQRLLQREHDVAQLRRPLEVAALGGGGHLRPQRVHPLAGLPLEEGAGGLDPLAVGRGGHDVVAPVELGADVVVEAPRAVGQALRGPVGEEHAELAPHLRERAAQQAAVGERPEVARAVLLAQAGEPEARQLLP